MYTECPNCHTYFKITPEQLKAAGGKVRCGGCNHVFNALTHLVEKVPAQRKKTAIAEESKSANVATPKSPPKSDVDFDGVSSDSSSQSINLADTEPSEESLLLDDFDIAADLPEPSRQTAIEHRDDIKKDIDDALNDLFDDETELLPASSNSSGEHFSELALELEKGKAKTTSKPLVSELDLSDDFDELLAENHQDASDPPLEAMSDNDSFLSNDALKTEQEEWETLTRPRLSEEDVEKNGSKLEAMKGYASGGFKVSRNLWIAIIVFLLFVLLGQFVYSKHNELIKYPVVRPVLEQACAALDLVVGCQLPEPRDVAAIVVIDTVVAGHPSAENALLITASIRSDAIFNQPFPELILTFSDFDKNILARRIFKPREYLLSDVDIRSGMFEKVPVNIMLEIVDPGERAINYEFDFR